MPDLHGAEFVSVLEPHHQEIVDCVARGMSTTDIARHLGVLKSTVVRYVSHCQITIPDAFLRDHDSRAARDAEITRLRGDGMSMKDISRRLDLGYETVRVFCRRAGIL